MDFSLFFTNLNYLSILLMIIFAITMFTLLLQLVVYVVKHKSCPKLDHFDPQRFKGKLHKHKVTCFFHFTLV